MWIELGSLVVVINSVSWAGPRKDKPISYQRLSHWLVEVIGLACENKGIEVPRGLGEHSTLAMVL